MEIAILGTIAVVIAFVVVGRWIDRRWSLMPKPEELVEAQRPRLPGDAHAPGGAPQVAIRADAARRAKLVARQRCAACRAEMVADGEDDIRYEGRRLLVIRLRCPACGATRGLYVDPA